MAKKRFEYCHSCAIRAEIEARREVPPAKPTPIYVQAGRESPDDFWERVERAGLLREAVALYDELAIEQRTRTHTRRETKQEFEQRIISEGRRGDAEYLRAKLAALGLDGREVQAQLVEILQPRAGDNSSVADAQSLDPGANLQAESGPR
jgi:hypothetical protein